MIDSISEERRLDLVKSRKRLYNAINDGINWPSLDAVTVLSPEIDDLDGLMNKLMGKFCALVGHESIPDHCGKPEHDYCEWCREITSGAWSGRGNLWNKAADEEGTARD